MSARIGVAMARAKGQPDPRIVNMAGRELAGVVVLRAAPAITRCARWRCRFLTCGHEQYRSRDGRTMSGPIRVAMRCPLCDSPAVRAVSFFSERRPIHKCGTVGVASFVNGPLEVVLTCMGGCEIRITNNRPMQQTIDAAAALVFGAKS